MKARGRPPKKTKITTQGSITSNDSSSQSGVTPKLKQRKNRINGHNGSDAIHLSEEEMNDFEVAKPLKKTRTEKNCTYFFYFYFLQYFKVFFVFFSFNGFSFK